MEKTKQKIENILKAKIDIFDDKKDLDTTRQIKKHAKALNNSITRLKYSLEKINKRFDNKNEKIKQMELDAIQRIKQQQIHVEIQEKRNRLKDELLIQIKLDEEERIKLEDELADVRSEEIKIVNLLNNEDRKIVRNIDPRQRINIDEYEFNKYN